MASDYDIQTKTYVKSRISNAVGYELPLLNLAMQNQNGTATGKGVEWFIQKDDLSGNAQAGGPFTPIVARRKNILAAASLPWSFCWNTDLLTLAEYTTTRKQTWTDESFVTKRGEAILEGLKIAIDRQLWGLDGIGSDSALTFKSIRQMLGHDVTFGGLARATTVTNAFHQSASLARTFADQDTEEKISVDLLRRIRAACGRTRKNADGKQGLVHFCGEELWLALQRELTSYVGYRPEGFMSKLGFGFEDFEVDKDSVVKVNSLYDANYKGTETTYPSRWLISVDPAVVNMMLEPNHAFKVGYDDGEMWHPQNTQQGGNHTYLGEVNVMGAWFIDLCNRCCMKTNVRA